MSLKTNVRTAFSLLALFAIASAATAANNVIFVHNTGIELIPIPATTPTQIWSGAFSDVAIDTVTRDVYWGDGLVPGNLMKGSSTHTGLPTIVATTVAGTQISDLAIDPSGGGTAYWIARDVNQVINDAIYSATLPGGAPTFIPISPTHITDLKLDLRPGHMHLYVLDNLNNALWRYDLPSGANEVPVAGAIGSGQPAKFALNPCTDEVYFISSTNPKPGVPTPYVAKATLSYGPNPTLTGATVLYSGASVVGNTADARHVDIAIDSRSQTIYWNSVNSLSLGQIVTAPTSGIGTPTVQATAAQGVYGGIALDLDDYACPAPDLSVTKTASPSPVVVGQNLTYTFTYQNNGASSIANIVVQETIPQCATWISNSNPSTGGTCLFGAGVVTCNVDPLNPGASGTFTVTVGASTDLTSCQTIHNDNYTITSPGTPPIFGPLIETPIVDDPNTVGVNKDLQNTTGQIANDLEILIQGSYTAVNHYDGVSPRFNTFTVTPAVGGNTHLRWSNPDHDVQPNEIVHVGFNLPGSTVNILGVFWTRDGEITGCANQVSTNTHAWGTPGSAVIYANNCLACEAVPRYVGSLAVEWYAKQVPLGDLNAFTVRLPIRTDVIRSAPILLAAGREAEVGVPQAPPNASFGVIVHKVGSNPALSGADVTTDFLQFPVAKTSVDIKTLSTRPDRVSGGDVLVQITQDNATATPVTLNGADVTSVFRAGAVPNTRVGLVTGLVLGTNTLASSGVSLTIKNYPMTGPITSGPHNTPFFCQTQDFMLPDGSKFGLPTDADCSAPTKITYLYLPTGGTALVPLPSTSSLPSNVAQTTTTTGATVNFIVRVETAVINRGIYQTAVLHDPTVEAAPTWFAPPRGWNKRLIAIEGFGCPGGWYIQGAGIGSLTLAGLDFNLLSPARLGAGYAMFSNTLQHASNSCNSVLSGESAMMSKEHFIETFGVPVWTASYGCSGGSYGSSQLADALPGLFDGIMIACTFPDPLGIAFSGSDGHLLTHYFNVTNPTGFTTAQQVAVSGYKGLQAFIDAANQSGRTDPVPGRVDIPGYASAVWNAAVPVSMRYNPTTNPGGLRPTVYDWGRNIYGVNPATQFALRPFDNVGVQYGLAALNAGQITTTQFLSLNEFIGGYDQDANYVANRVAGDLGAIARAQQSGLQLGGNGGLASIPVFDVSGIYNDDGGYHYQWFHFAMRERMLQASVNTDNHVMWRGNPVNADQAWETFEQWLEAVAADTSALSQREKTIRNKPALATDGCWKTVTTGFWKEKQTFSRTNNSVCNALYPSYAFPRYVAGGPLAANIIKCQLKPLTPSDYSVTFTSAELARLNRIFPSGVCDWSKSGVNQSGVIPWASFGPAPENLIFDITKP